MDFAPAGATRGLSARPLDPFGRTPMLLVGYVYWHLVSGQKVHKLKNLRQKQAAKEAPKESRGRSESPLEAAEVTIKLE